MRSVRLTVALAVAVGVFAIGAASASAQLPLTFYSEEHPPGTILSPTNAKFEVLAYFYNFGLSEPPEECFDHTSGTLVKNSIPKPKVNSVLIRNECAAESPWVFVAGAVKTVKMQEVGASVDAEMKTSKFEFENPAHKCKYQQQGTKLLGASNTLKGYFDASGIPWQGRLLSGSGAGCDALLSLNVSLYYYVPGALHDVWVED